MFGFFENIIDGVSNVIDEITGEAERRRVVVHERWYKSTQEAVLLYRKRFIALAFTLHKQAVIEEAQEDIQFLGDLSHFHKVMSDLENVLNSSSLVAIKRHYKDEDTLSILNMKNVGINSEKVLLYAQEVHPYDYSEITYKGKEDTFLAALNKMMLNSLNINAKLRKVWVNAYSEVTNIIV